MPRYPVSRRTPASANLANILLLLLLTQSAHPSESSAAGTETLIGLVGRDYVLLAASTSSSSSGIAYTSSDLDKIYVLSDPRRDEANGDVVVAAAAAGCPADADRILGAAGGRCTLAEYGGDIGRDVRVVFDGRARGGTDGAAVPASVLGPDEVGHMIRGAVSDGLRKAGGKQLKVAMLVGGMGYGTAEANGDGDGRSDTSVLRPRLLWIDEYGSLLPVRYGAHGHGSNFLLSTLDARYRPDMDRQEAVGLLRDCFRQLGERYVINSPRPPCIKCVDSSGCELIV